jgi:hypothetical protein
VKGVLSQLLEAMSSSGAGAVEINGVVLQTLVDMIASISGRVYDYKGKLVVKGAYARAIDLIVQDHGKISIAFQSSAFQTNAFQIVESYNYKAHAQDLKPRSDRTSKVLVA